MRKPILAALPALLARSTLNEFDDLGHSPQIEAPKRFNRRRLEALGAPRGRGL